MEQVSSLLAQVDELEALVSPQGYVEALKDKTAADLAMILAKNLTRAAEDATALASSTAQKRGVSYIPPIFGRDSINPAKIEIVQKLVRSASELGLQENMVQLGQGRQLALSFAEIGGLVSHIRQALMNEKFQKYFEAGKKAMTGNPSSGDPSVDETLQLSDEAMLEPALSA